MQDATLVRVLQGVGQKGADPANRIHVSGVSKELAGLAALGKSDGKPCLDLLQGIEQMPAVALMDGPIPQYVEQRSQRGTAEVRQAQGAQKPIGKILDGIEWDDVGVLKARQRQVLAG